MRVRRIVLSLCLLAFTMGHDHGGCGSVDGDPTEAACDPRLRWDNFGQSFMDRYCTSCHSSAIHGGNRRGAPPDHNYDSIEGVQKDLDHLDRAAAAGPAADNEAMPPYGPAPTADERAQLGAWIACGAP